MESNFESPVSELNKDTETIESNNEIFHRKIIPRQKSIYPWIKIEIAIVCLSQTNRPLK